MVIEGLENVVIATEQLLNRHLQQNEKFALDSLFNGKSVSFGKVKVIHIKGTISTMKITIRR